jgi:uncharacterized protein
MHITLEPLQNSPGKTFIFTLSPEADDVGLTEDGMLFSGPLDIRLEAVCLDGKIHVKGSLRAKVVLDCSRCLQELTFPMDGEYENEWPAGDDTELDTDELVREMFYTNLPLKPLCDEDCRGLCTVCGENLNDKQCGCQVGEVDHRLTILKKLLQE